jgi:type II secretory pathway component PulK
MACPAPFKSGSSRTEAREGGVALFMVVAAITLLAVLVTEFTYMAQVNARMAFDSVDQVKAHAMAKSGLKLSLLRLKAYQTVKGVAGDSGAGGMVPKSLLEKIWSFPFFFPIPSNAPGLSPGERDKIEAFTKGSGLEGSFSAVIESESNKYNLNSLLAPFAAQAAAPPPPSTAEGGGSQPAPSTPQPTPSFNPEAVHNSLADYLTQLLNQRMETDDAFASDYRDFRMDELIDNLIQWVDPSYERRSAPSRTFKPKGGPFYSLAELRMVEPIDDELYELFAPHLTVSSTPGINVNTIKDLTLRALIPGMTPEEIEEFFKFRDSVEADNQFKTADDFFKYLQGNVAAFRGSENEMQKFRDGLAQRGIRIITDESHFKITVQARVNQATRLIEAWATLSSKPAAAAPPGTGMPPAEGQTQAPDAGLRITSMRFL